MIPGTIRILGNDYLVQLRGSEVMHNGLGWCDSVALQIHIQSGLPASVESETLLHEIGHAIFEATSLKDTSDEERIVQCFGMGINAVLRDNPLLREYLLKA